jgi:hypothetical protein
MCGCGTKGIAEDCRTGSGGGHGTASSSGAACRGGGEAQLGRVGGEESSSFKWGRIV